MARLSTVALLLLIVFVVFLVGLASGNPSPARKAEGKKDHCNKTVDIYEDVSSPEVTPENFGKPLTCWYRFRSFRGTPKDWILRIKFNKFKVGSLLNASHCQGGYMQAFSSTVPEHLSPDDIKLECTTKLGISPEEIEKVFGGNLKPIEENEHIKNYLACVWKKCNFISDKGEIDSDLLLHVVEPLMLRHHGVDDLEQVIDAIVKDCRNAPHGLHDTAVKVHNCIMDRALKYGDGVIVDGNAKTDVSNRKEPGMFCGETEQPQTFMSETSFVKVVFHVDNFTDQTYFSFDTRAEQQLVVYLRYGQHPELYPNRRGEVVQGSYCERIFRDCRLQTCYVQSPAYPGVYPRNLHCRYYLNTRLPFIKLYIENEEFNIDGQRCENIMTCPMRPISSGQENCPYDYIKIYDGKNEFSPVIGTFCGMGKFPYSIIGTSQDLFVEFLSSPAGPLLNTGFHFNVGNWPGHVDTAGSRNGTCDWLLSSESLRASGDSEGIFLSVAHWYPPHTSCTYLMQGEEGEIVRLYFPSFRINRIESPIQPIDGDCGESLTLYDSSWPDDSKIIKTFCDTFSKPMEKHDFVSTGNALFVRFESKTGSYSGSSLYYWAHYDFFNNTKLGEPVPEKPCDEVFASWRATKGWLRSPLNTLVYKQTPNSEDVQCLYRFVTDRRLYARVILTVMHIHFKEHPYNPGPCSNCLEDRIDKIVIWEPLPPGANGTYPQITLTKAAQIGEVTCLCNRHTGTTQVISRGEQLNLQLIIDSAHAALSYFKHNAPLFEASYEFVHGPLCGPPIIQPTTDGEIHYPYYEAIGYVEPPKSIRCIWEIRVNRERDLWMHFDRIKFASKSCDDGVVDIFLKGKTEPHLSVCGENVSLAKELPILSAAQLSPDGSEPGVTIQFVGRTSPTRAAFKIAWTELFHLPRNKDGSLMTSRLTEGGTPEDSIEACEFACPGEAGLCIPARLVCNGVINCPNVTNSKETSFSDESEELCVHETSPEINWLYVALAIVGIVVLLCCICVCICRKCCRYCCVDD